jgi:hypothetical protein
MRTLLFSFLLSLFVAISPAFALRLVWDPPAQGVPTGYVVYSRLLGDSSEPFSESVDAPTCEYPLERTRFLPGQEYEFWVTAYNDAGESPPSNTVTNLFDPFSPPLNPPPVVILIPSKVMIQVVE